MSELHDAFKAYLKAKEWKSALDCVKYLYIEEKDYQSVVDLRTAMGKRFKKVREMNILDYARETYFLTAKEKFDDYMVAMEWERPPKQKFYLPRRQMLLPIVHQMQRLADDELDILSINAPPGIGKTGLGDFFMTFTAGRHPDKGMLMGSHSKSILNDNYNECLRMLSGDEYCWEEIFQGHHVVKTNALDMKIDVDTARKFSTFQFGSLGSGLAGRLRAQSLLYVDDLIDKLETALSIEQLNKIWHSFTTDYLQRMQGDCKILMIMTNWSVHDPSRRLEEANEGNKRAYFLKMKALDDNDESNFDYGGDIGFTTKYYHKLRDTLDPMEWNALYMSDPVEREGLVFPEEELQYYWDLPSEKPDAVLGKVDTKSEGTDDCVFWIGYQYGDKFYMDDVICDDSLPEVTTPRIVDKCIEHSVKMVDVESNLVGVPIAKEMRELIKKSHGITSISSTYTTKNKEIKILTNAGWIKRHCLFRAKDVRTREYDKAMKLLCGFTKVSKKKKDDVPDCLSMFAEWVQDFEYNTLVVKSRIF